MKTNTRKLVLMSLFIALSLVGSYIKIPSPIQSIALDSMPAYLGGLILGGIEGGIIGFLGHILTSANTGFPLSLLVHIIVAIMMFTTIYLYNFTYRNTNLIIASIVAIIINGVGSPLVLTLLPQFGWPFFMGIVPFLVLVSTVNVILSVLVFIPLKNSSFLKERGIDCDNK